MSADVRPSRRFALGFLYPGYAAEDDYPRMAAIAGAPVVAEVVHTSVGEDAHRIDALLDLGAPGRLLEGVAALRSKDVRAIVWACTSGSFVYGWQGAHDQVAEVEQASGIPTSSTSIAFAEAVQALGLRRVAIAATYPKDVSASFEAFLEAAGVEVVQMGYQDILTAVEVGGLGRERVMRMVREHDHPRAEAVLVPDTALHSAAWLGELEAMAGKPVLTANQVSFWKALRLAGDTGARGGLGALLLAGG
jgi:maleate cis-trans isomerase